MSLTAVNVQVHLELSEKEDAYQYKEKNIIG